MSAGDLQFLPNPGAPGHCAFCRADIGDAAVVRCPRCDAAYHADCWDANSRRCAIYGCEPGVRPPPAPRPRLQPTPAPARRSRSWGGLWIFGGIVLIRLFSSLATSHHTPTVYRPPVEPLELRKIGAASAKFMVGMGDRSLGTWHLQEAMSYYSKAIDLAPTLAEAWRSRGAVKDYLGDPQGALTDLQEAVALNPDDAVSYEIRGRVKNGMGDHQGAVDEYSNAIVRSPYDGRLYYERGCARYDGQDWKTCVRDFRTAIERSFVLADDGMIRMFLARTRMGEGQDALEELKSCLADPALFPDEWTRTRFRYAARQMSEEDFLRSLDAAPGPEAAARSAQAWFLVGSLRLIAKDAAGAEDYFRMCVNAPCKPGPEFACAKAELQALYKRR